MTGFTRRTVGGLVLAGLAGCTGLGDSGGNGAVFEDVRVEGTSLVVEFDGSAEVDSVTVVSPDGSEFASRSVGAGVSKVSVKIGTRYSAGEHSVVAAREGESAGETTIDIRPDVEIVEVGVGANNLDRMPDGLGTTKEEEALVRIENTGSGPQEIEKLLFLGDVPNPTTDLAEVDDSQYHVSGIYDTGQEYAEYDSILLQGGESRTIFTSTLPFSFQGDGVDCTSTEKTGEFEVRAIISVGEEPISHTARVRYSPQEDGGNCDIRVEEGE